MNFQFSIFKLTIVKLEFLAWYVKNREFIKQ